MLSAGSPSGKTLFRRKKGSSPNPFPKTAETNKTNKTNKTNTTNTTNKTNKINKINKNDNFVEKYHFVLLTDDPPQVCLSLTGDMVFQLIFYQGVILGSDRLQSGSGISNLPVLA